MAMQQSTPKPERASLREGRSLEKPVAPPPTPPRKFTALIDRDTEQRFDLVTRHVGDQLGRIAGRAEDGDKGGRLPSRADVLRALVGLAAEPDSKLLHEVVKRVEQDIQSRRSTVTP